jgi:sterol desaturase/sphingolipid hydroxylase (fatty acid hydroxylase superfamily)
VGDEAIFEDTGMDWLTEIGESWLGTLSWVLWLGVPFSLLALLMPCNRDRWWWNDWRATGTDLLYWFLSPLMARVVRTLVVTEGITLLCGSKPGFDAIREMPMWLQCIAVFAFQDVLLYWIHRAFHSSAGWKFHAIHHSPRMPDFLSAGRSHIINTLLSFVLADVVALMLGFTPEALIAMIPLGLVWSSMVHANLSWTFGPLRYVLASPVFHRWHHVAEGEGINKNFASTFPVLDLLFGTFYMPAGAVPEYFGNGEEHFPEGFFGQLIFPFLPRKAAEQPAAKILTPAPRQPSRKRRHTARAA